MNIMKRRVHRKLLLTNLCLYLTIFRLKNKMPKLANTSLLFTLYRNRKLGANGHCSFLSLSETFRSVKNFILAFLKRSEAWKTSFWSFWNVQKHEKLLFCLSAVCRSMKNFFLVFLQCAEAWKTSIWCFWNIAVR